MFIHPSIYFPFCLYHFVGYFTFFWQSRTSASLLTPLPSSTSLSLPSPPLTQQRMESWGEKSWRQARIISYICPHFLQKMIDLANYPMLPSPLAHAMRPPLWRKSTLAWRVPHSWCYMTIHELRVNGEEEISDRVMAVCECNCSRNDFNKHVFFSPLYVENEFGGDVVSRSSPAESQ